jgi:SAM-dependent methyltransferase
VKVRSLLGRWGRTPDPPPPSHVPRSAPALSEEELLARAEAFNRAADVYWKDVLSEPSARRHVLNKPFGGVTTAPGMLYRLGLLLSELRLGLGHTVLDFGAGSGWLSSCLNRLGCRTIAVDVSPTALELGRELFSLDARHRPELEPRFLRYDGHRLPVPDASVDRIACFDAFHHVPNQDEVLAEFHRVLRPGGRAVLAEPGEGHSHSECSTFETDRCGVLENELDVLDLDRRARRAGFTAVSLKPYPDPDTLRLGPAEYVALMEGDVRGFPVDALARSLRNFFLVTLAKGEERPDSRNPSRLRAAIESRGPAGGLRGRSGASLELPLTIRNDGDTEWRHEENPVGGYVLLSAHLLDGEGQLVRHGFLRQLLPANVLPGESIEVTAAVTLPVEAGAYRLRFDLVDEHVMWFAQMGSPTLDVPVEVEAGQAPGGLRARLEAGDGGVLRGPAGTALPFRVRLTNEGRDPWPHAPEPRPHTVSLAGHLLEKDGAMHERDVLHLALPRTVAPGESIDVLGSVRAPLAPGTYRLKLDLVLEHVCWFEQRGSLPLALPVEVTEEVPDSANPGVLHASLELLAGPGPVRAAGGSTLGLRLRVRNLGNTRWLHAARPRGGHVTLGGHLLEEGRAMVNFDYLRASLPRDVEPGETIEWEATVPVPVRPGRHLLELDLVNEGVAWFAALGSPTVTLTLDVAP